MDGESKPRSETTSLRGSAELFVSPYSRSDTATAPWPFVTEWTRVLPHMWLGVQEAAPFGSPELSSGLNAARLPTSAAATPSLAVTRDGARTEEEAGYDRYR